MQNSIHLFRLVRLLSCVLARPASRKVAMIFTSAQYICVGREYYGVCVCERERERETAAWRITAACDDRAAMSN